MELPLARFRNADAWRIIPTRFPPVDLFQDVAGEADWTLLNELEGRTNERLIEQVFSRGLIRTEDYVEKSSSHYIIGPLTHPNPDGSRFCDDTAGVVYAGLDFETTLAEVKRQREEFLRRTSERPQRLDMRVILMTLDGELHDLRGNMENDWSNQAETRALAAALRAQGSYGIVFDSDARSGGQCAAVFRPPVLSNCRQERHLAFLWDGTSITDVLEYTKARELSHRSAKDRTSVPSTG